MKFCELLALSPVNKMAAIVTSQTGCVEVDREIGKPELARIVDRLCRKHRLLKVVLGIKNKSQHQNLMRKFNLGKKQYRAKKEPRAFVEYVLIGRQIQSLSLELAEMRKVRRFVYELEHKEAA